MTYDSIASRESIETTIATLAARNVHAELVETKEAALARLKELIPAGASVMTGASVTLEQIGFTEFLKSGTHQWNNLKAAVAAEKDPITQSKLRKQATLADYYLGSIHAVTEDGEIIIASNTGSQLPAYAYSSANIVWVVGAQKIVANFDEAMKRLKEYVVPLEDRHMKDLGAAGTNLGKILLFESEFSASQRTIRLIFVNEKLGF
jgi:hypothetical protein